MWSIFKLRLKKHSYTLEYRQSIWVTENVQKGLRRYVESRSVNEQFVKKAINLTIKMSTAFLNTIFKSAILMAKTV